MRTGCWALILAWMIGTGGAASPAQDSEESRGKGMGARPHPGPCLHCPLHCPKGPPPGLRDRERPGPAGECPPEGRRPLGDLLEDLTPEERDQLHRFMMMLRQRRLQRERCEEGPGPRPRPGMGPGEGRPGRGPGDEPDRGPGDGPRGRGRGGPKGDNGVGNGEDPQPPGDPPVNDGPGTGPGNPGRRGGQGQGGGRR